MGIHVRIQQFFFWVLVAFISPQSWAAHPLVTDDTGTQGQGKWQYELSQDAEKQALDPVAMARHSNLSTTLTYGLNNNSDIAISLSHEHSSDPASIHSGIGDVLLQSKWRFYENAQGWSLALKPVVSLPTGNTHKGFGAGHSTVAGNLIAQYSQQSWLWMGNVGVQWNHNRLQEYETVWNASLASTYALGEQWALMAEWSVHRDPDPNVTYHPQQITTGLAWHPTPALDLDLGLRRSVRHAEHIHGAGAGLTYRW